MHGHGVAAASEHAVHAPELARATAATTGRAKQRPVGRIALQSLERSIDQHERTIRGSGHIPDTAEQQTVGLLPFADLYGGCVFERPRGTRTP